MSGGMKTQSSPAAVAAAAGAGGHGNHRAKNFEVLKKQSLHVTFELSGTEYDPVENIGIGAYGVVCSAVRRKTKDKVAIKKIPDIFLMHPSYALRTYREIRILRHFRHDNVIAIRDILKPRGDVRSFGEIYVVLDLMESDLHKIIYSRQTLTEEHVRYFLYQILRGLKYIHSAKVIHRDLKPSNILINENCELKIGDFGMARGGDIESESKTHNLTQYVATRWYRAPELILSHKDYGAKIDMWSVGCIFAELLRRKHLFPGNDTFHQVRLIIGILGAPTPTYIDGLHSPLVKDFIKGLGDKEPVPLNLVCPNQSPDVYTMLSSMLVLDPAHRVSVEVALSHSYLSKYHDPIDEPVCRPHFDFSFESEISEIEAPEDKKDQLRDLIYTEILAFNKPQPKPLDFSELFKLSPLPLAESPNTSTPQPSSQGAPVAGDFASLISQLSRAKPFEPALLSGSDNSIQEPHSAESSALSPPSLDTSRHDEAPGDDTDMPSAPIRPSARETSAERKEGRRREEGEGDDNSKVAAKDGDGPTDMMDAKARLKAKLLIRKPKQQDVQTSSKDDRKPVVTALQRQKERERRKKDKLARAKRKKPKEQSEGGLLTTEDKNLLERWSKMHSKPEPKRDIQPTNPVPDPTSTAPPMQNCLLLPFMNVNVVSGPVNTVPAAGAMGTAGPIIIMNPGGLVSQQTTTTHRAILPQQPQSHQPLKLLQQQKPQQNVQIQKNRQQEGQQQQRKQQQQQLQQQHHQLQSTGKRLLDSLVSQPAHVRGHSATSSVSQVTAPSGFFTHSVASSVVNLASSRPHVTPTHQQNITIIGSSSNSGSTTSGSSAYGVASPTSSTNTTVPPSFPSSTAVVVNSPTAGPTEQRPSYSMGADVLLRTPAASVTGQVSASSRSYTPDSVYVGRRGELDPMVSSRAVGAAVDQAVAELGESLERHSTGSVALSAFPHSTHQQQQQQQHQPQHSNPLLQGIINHNQQHQLSRQQLHQRGFGQQHHPPAVHHQGPDLHDYTDSINGSGEQPGIMEMSMYHTFGMPQDSNRGPISDSLNIRVSAGGSGNSRPHYSGFDDFAHLVRTESGCLQQSGNNTTSVALSDLTQSDSWMMRAATEFSSLGAGDDSNIDGLANQLSHQRVNDPLPPVLVSTPRTGGAGYGVGSDLDAALRDFNAGLHSVAAPVSASLVSDWMDMTETGTLDNREMEALQGELEMGAPFYDFTSSPPVMP